MTGDIPGGAPEWLLALVRAQRNGGFADVAGAEAMLTLPLSDGLINQVVAERLPRDGPVSALDITAMAGDQFEVRVRLRHLSFLPPIPIGVLIDRQPDLPARPVLGLRILSPLIAAAAGPLAGFFKSLPPWIRLDGPHVSIDLAAAAASCGAAEAFGYVRAVALTTSKGRVIVSIRASVPAPGDDR
jgi:hypothetical protein